MIRQILLVPHTHHDVGYTASPRIVDDLHVRVVGEVLRLCERHDAAGPDGFRWTFEVARPVLRFLDRAGEVDVGRLRRLVHAGRVSVTGGYLNMTQLPSMAELDAGYDALGALRAAGIPVRTQQHGDVNGIAWGSVDGMRRAGIERLVMALNPDHGRAPFEQPTAFWWEAPGGGRVLVWLSTHYGVGEQWGLVDGDTVMAEACVAGFVERLETRADYPFDVAVVHAANDNRWPTAKLLDVVRHWNATHPGTPMRTATIDQALDVVQGQVRESDLPVVRGEWSDWWSHGHGSTAREVAVYREARSFARAAQAGFGLALLGDAGSRPATAEVIGYRRGPVRLRGDEEVVAGLAAVDEQLSLFGEHTWGSWETYRRPHSTFSHSHWNAKAGYAYAAYDLARDLAIEAMFRVAAPAGSSEGEGVLVVNPTERDRTEPVVVEVDGTERRRLVATAPAFGVTLAPLPGPPRRRTGHEIALGAYRVRVDAERGGVVSLVDVRSGRELVDGDAGHGLGAVVVERPLAGSAHPMLHGDPKAFHPDCPGPEFDRHAAVGGSGDGPPEIAESPGLAGITWRTTAPGVPEISTTLTLHEDLDVVDVEVDVVKPERFGPESVFVAFPFAVGDPEFLLETAGAVYAAGTEQLPDTSRDWYSIQHAVGVTDGVHGLLWGSFDAPLVQLGGFHTGQWARTLDAPHGHVNSWLMNNLHFTNFQARQDGTRRYRYRFAARGVAVSREDVAVFGRDLLEPLQARQYRGPVRQGGRGPRVEPAGPLLAEIRPAGSGAVRVRLRNVVAEPVDGAVVWDGERYGVRVPGYGTADVVVDRQGRMR
jgi:alpha-mannosidase